MGKKLEEILDVKKIRTSEVYEIKDTWIIKDRETLKALLQLGPRGESLLLDGAEGKKLTSVDLDKMTDEQVRHLHTRIGGILRKSLFKDGEESILMEEYERRKAERKPIRDIFDQAEKLGDVAAHHKIEQIKSGMQPASYRIEAQTIKPLEKTPSASLDLSKAVNLALHDLGLTEKGRSNADYMTVDGKAGACFSLSPESYKKFKQMYNPQETDSEQIIQQPRPARGR